MPNYEKKRSVLTYTVMHRITTFRSKRTAYTTEPRSLALRVEAGPNKKTGHKQI